MNIDCVLNVRINHPDGVFCEKFPQPEISKTGKIRHKARQTFQKHRKLSFYEMCCSS